MTTAVVVAVDGAFRVVTDLGKPESLADLLTALSVHRTVVRAIAKSELVGVQFGGGKMIPIEPLMRYLEQVVP